MPHWVPLVGIVVAAWLVVSVVGGWLVGRGLGAIERRADVEEPEAEHELRRAA
jgi:hypothetical protein